MPAVETAFFSHNNITIYNRDFLELRSIPAKSVDLIITSPPYNLDIPYGVHEDKMPHAGYLQFTRKWMSTCYDLVRDDGRMCLNVPLDRNKEKHWSVYADFVNIARDAGWTYRSTIVWNKQVISPQFTWGTWMSAAAPCIIAPVEMIVVLYKRTWKKCRGARRDDVTRDEFLSWTNGLWTFRAESKKRIGHPAPFPVELPRAV